MSERRACRLLSADRSSYRYRQRTKNDEALCERLLVLAARHPRYGYRRLGALLRREGQRVNHKKVERLYREQGLALRRRKRKRLTAALTRRRFSEPTSSSRWTSSATQPNKDASSDC